MQGVGARSRTRNGEPSLPVRKSGRSSRIFTLDELWKGQYLQGKITRSSNTHKTHTDRKVLKSRRQMTPQSLHLDVWCTCGTKILDGSGCGRGGEIEMNLQTPSHSCCGSPDPDRMHEGVMWVRLGPVPPRAHAWAQGFVSEHPSAVP